MDELQRLKDAYDDAMLEWCVAVEAGGPGYTTATKLEVDKARDELNQFIEASDKES